MERNWQNIVFFVSVKIVFEMALTVDIKYSQETNNIKYFRTICYFFVDFIDRTYCYARYFKCSVL